MTRSVEVIESTPAETAISSVSALGQCCEEQHERPASDYVRPLPADALAGNSGHLWCDHCELMITVPHYDVPHTHTCECRGELRQVPGCKDCGAVRSHNENDWCDDCDLKWAARERARSELRSALIGVTLPLRGTA